VDGRASTRRLYIDLLAHAGRLLLEYNESSAEIDRALAATSRSVTKDAYHAAISYNGIAVSLGSESPTFLSVRELRYNNSVQTRVHTILKQVREGKLEAAMALAQLDTAGGDVRRHARTIAIVALGMAAAALAGLLGGDTAAVAVVGLATGFGLFARQELGRRNFSLLALPLAAAFIGAVFGGLAIRFVWTHTPELVLIVPALMLVPGPHLINGALDLIDNYVPMSLSRFWLAAGILLASGLGIALGAEITLPDRAVVSESGAGIDHLNLFMDMLLAGIVTCGFAIFYNAAWRHVAMATLGGMAGHGLRFLALKAGCTLEAATFLGGLVVGVVSACMARPGGTPIAVISFAGAVTMIPGLDIYRALAGALQMARLPENVSSAAIATTVGNASQACLMVGGLVLGLILGARGVQALAGTAGGGD
jgi:uncharacterized membrane protein YjjP (DUF1212 family)